MKAKPNGRHAAGGPTRAAIYCRVSSEVQGQKVSPEEQLADAEAYAKAHGYIVVGVYRDVDRYRSRGRLVEPSGTRVDRPGFVQLLADAAAGQVDVILAWKADRLYRGVKPAVLVDDLLEASHVRVELVRETFDRKTLFIMAAIGRMELDNIRERTEMGMRARVRSGMIHGGPVPAGYTAVPGENGAAAGYVLDEGWRGFFDDLARLYLQRLPLAEIARQLGPNPRTGRPWVSGQISYLLRNPFYRGQVAYGWQSGSPEFTVPGRHAPAWDAATCAAIERELARRGGRHNAPRGRALLSGVLRCGICGRAMKAGITTTRNRAGAVTGKYRTYGCDRPALVRDNRWFGRRTHDPNYINEHRALSLIRDLFASLTPQAVDEYLAPAMMALSGTEPDDDTRRPRLEAEREQLVGRLADLTLGLDGVRHASPAAAEAILAAMTTAGKQLDRIRADLAEIDTRQRAAPDLAQARAAMLYLIEHPDAFEAEPEQLQPLLREAFPALYVRRGALSLPVAEWQD